MVLIAACLVSVLAQSAPTPTDGISSSWLGRQLPKVRSEGCAWLGQGRPESGAARSRVVVWTDWSVDGAADVLPTLVRWHARDRVAVTQIVHGLTDANVQGAVAALRKAGVAYPVLDDRRRVNATRFGVAGTGSHGFLLHAAETVVLEGAPFDGRFQREIRRLSAPPRAHRLDFEAHVQALRGRLPHRGFQVVVQRPFVVIGDEPLATVKRRARSTVKWAVDLLRKDYFARTPDHIIDVWLFKSRGSYNKHTEQLFGERPTTPYGFYSPRHRALIMNIATGGGTLCHEIVHPFVATNFPACPSWLNEGLGSLYEQCNERGGRIVGLLNWRLPGIQSALREKRAPTFAALCATTDDEFYGEEQGVHYAQARYLCYYLQERGLLRGFYRAFVANHPEDPSGYHTLRRVLRRADMQEFEKDWARFVLELER